MCCRVCNVLLTVFHHDERPGQKHVNGGPALWDVEVLFTYPHGPMPPFRGFGEDPANVSGSRVSGLAHDTLGMIGYNLL